jgi:hypothetical protein
MKAFPNHRSEGMDLRDAFAAIAMLGEMLRDKNAGYVLIAEDAYVMADEMMKARELS